jgi:hypothetical protein
VQAERGALKRAGAQHQLLRVAVQERLRRHTPCRPSDREAYFPAVNILRLRPQCWQPTHSHQGSAVVLLARPALRRELHACMLQGGLRRHLRVGQAAEAAVLHKFRVQAALPRMLDLQRA